MTTKFKLGMFQYPGCLVVSNTAVEEDGDYKTVAHISHAGRIKWFVPVTYVPGDALLRIEHEADAIRASFDARYDADAASRPYYLMDKVLDSLSISEYLDWTKRRSEYPTIQEALEAMKETYAARI